ncbi:MAG: hypothetical protein RSB77_06240 [Bacilli bacterium]
MNNDNQTNFTSDLLKDISWKYIIDDCDKKGVDIILLQTESRLYRDIEEEAIACFINNPNLLETTILKDYHFINKSMLLMFKFFKRFYEKYNNLNLSLMLSRAKDKEKLYCLFRIIKDYNMGIKSNFKIIEKEVIEKYRLTKIKEEFIKTIYGDCTIEDFKENIKEI